MSQSGTSIRLFGRLWLEFVISIVVVGVSASIVVVPFALALIWIARAASAFGEGIAAIAFVVALLVGIFPVGLLALAAWTLALHVVPLPTLFDG